MAETNIFNGNDGTWKRYLKQQLKPVGGLFFMNCNYVMNCNCCGGHSSVECLLQKAIGNESVGILKKYEWIKNWYNLKIIMNLELFL